MHFWGLYLLFFHYSFFFCFLQCFITFIFSCKNMVSYFSSLLKISSSVWLFFLPEYRIKHLFCCFHKWHCWILMFLFFKKTTLFMKQNSHIKNVIASNALFLKICNKLCWLVCINTMQIIYQNWYVYFWRNPFKLSEVK